MLVCTEAGRDEAVASPTDGSVIISVVYIYDGDTAAAEAFRSLLDSRGFETYLLALADVSGADFAGCDLILVGPDTGAWPGGPRKPASTGWPARRTAS
jgi:hypothetical protein